MIYLISLMPVVALFGYLVGHGYRELGAFALLAPTLAPLSRGCLRAIRRGLKLPPRDQVNQRVVALWVAYLVVTQVALVRALLNGSRDTAAGLAEVLFFSFVPTAILVAVGVVVRRRDPLRAIQLVGLSVALYVLLNVVGFLAGVTNPGVEDNYLRQLESMWSPTGYRLSFPFNLSGRMLAIVAGLTGVMLLSIPRGRVLPGSARMGAPLVFVSAVIILAGHGARAPVMAAIAVGALAIVARHWERVGRVALRGLVVAALVLPFVVLGTDWLEGLGDAAIVTSLGLTREAGDFASLSNRAVIWAAVGAYTVGVGPGVVFAGHGARGHVVSGLSDSWSALFETSYANPYEVSTHSTYVQIFVDSGVLGLGVFLALSWYSMSALWRAQNRIRDGGGAAFALLYLLITGSVETSLTYYSVEAWVPFWALVAISVYLPVPSDRLDGLPWITPPPPSSDPSNL